MRGQGVLGGAQANFEYRKPRPEAKPEPQLPTKVQTVVVTADENNMRVDRFLEGRFPGLSFSHIQRIVRKGELRVNGVHPDVEVTPRLERAIDDELADLASWLDLDLVRHER